jgi:ABC-2 type transport system permease protein
VIAFHVRGQHLRLVAMQYATHAIRGGTGIVFTLVMLLACLVIASIWVGPMEGKQSMRARFGNVQGAAVSDEEIIHEAKARTFTLVAWATDHDSKMEDHLTFQKPAAISATLMILLFAIPFLVCLGSFNQLSGDIQYKGLRYLLLRTERANLFLGRFIGTVLFTMMILAIFFLVLFLYMTFKARFYGVGEVALWLLQGYVAVVFFALPYIALCSWISASLNSPFLSLTSCELIAASVPVVVSLMTNTEPKFKYVGYIMPWPLKFELLHPNALHVLGAMGVMLAFTGLFVVLGLLTFQRRDL